MLEYGEDIQRLWKIMRNNDWHSAPPIPFYQNGVDITKDNWYQSEEGINRVFGEFTRYGNQFTEEFELLKDQKR